MPTNFANMPRAHLWRQICFCGLVIVISCFLVTANDIVEHEQLKLCSEQPEDPHPRSSLVFVSTLDGKISALDNDNGQKQWTFDSNSGPMLSSNIHHKELSNNGQWVRLVPSLSGGLYKFDGENLETVPISTDQLLYSSYRYSSDLVFAGGKEIYSYGVLASTGKVLYECNINECMNNTNEKYLEHEVLIVKRFQQTVRAIQALTGIESWNFSVGQHSLMRTLLPNVCANKVATDVDIKVVIPKGLIWAVSKSNPTIKLWEYKFDSPVVSIWREASTSQESLEEINLFDSSQWNWGSEKSIINPSLYIGMHEKQLYVQENFKSLMDKSLDYIQHKEYPWDPYPAVGNAAIDILLNKSDNIEVSDETNAQKTTAIAVLYNTEYVNGNGFYLFSKDQLNNKQCSGNNTDTLINSTQKSTVIYTEGGRENDTPIITMSLWYWWKEVGIIVFTSVILLNLYTRFYLKERLFYKSMLHIRNAFPLLIIEKHVETTRKDSINDNGENANFKSRYLTDFVPVVCLGRGGYGVVFEAKNKIDDCNYAIKRIALPKSNNSRERVLREVKALAKLDHHNIVRYFNSWLECPPTEWLEEHDQRWIDKEKFPSPEFSSESTSTETKSHSVCIDVPEIDSSSVNSPCELNRVNVNDDSVVVFQNLSGEQHDNDAVYISGCSSGGSDLSISKDKTEEVSRDTNNDTTHSSNIIFERSNNSISEKEEKPKPSKSAKFSADLNDKSSTRKSRKMFLYIQMQLCQKLGLKEWLKESTTRDPLRVLDIFQQIVNAVEYVHLQGLIHRDLKPSNIFFAYDDKIKIGDFGLVTAMTKRCDEIHNPENESVTLEDNKHTARVGTYVYMAPEQMSGQIYNYKVDIFSLGIIFFELLVPFSTDMERLSILLDLKKSNFPTNFAENYFDEYNLLKMMLDRNPRKRPTTLGIKARPPLQHYESSSALDVDESSKWHFELPQLSRHSSMSSNTSGSSFES